MELYIAKPGFSAYEIKVHEQEELHIHVDERINASLLVSYSGVEAIINASTHLGQGSSLTLMLKNEITGKATLCLQAEVLQDASLTLALCELDAGALTADVCVTLKESGAYAMLRSACIAENEKHFTINCIHEAPYTTGLMEHYAVVKECGKYHMQATGKMVKGAYESASHQTTRVLTMSQKHNSEVEPVLLIDENNVKASHATTLGQPDENQLYYLQTRGLSRGQALGLLTVGYIMPITELFDDEEMNQKLKNEIEMKVGLHA